MKKLVRTLISVYTNLTFSDMCRR